MDQEHDRDVEIKLLRERNAELQRQLKDALVSIRLLESELVSRTTELSDATKRNAQLQEYVDQFREIPNAR